MTLIYRVSHPGQGWSGMFAEHGPLQESRLLDEATVNQKALRRLTRGLTPLGC